jgi:hypothetical protein
VAERKRGAGSTISISAPGSGGDKGEEVDEEEEEEDEEEGEETVENVEAEGCGGEEEVGGEGLAGKRND